MVVQTEEMPAPPPVTRQERLEDAVGAYFSGQFPLGSCKSRLDAETVITEAAHRALDRG